MENTPTGCGSDVPTIFRVLQQTPNIEKRRHSASGWIWTQTVLTKCFTSQSSAQTNDVCEILVDESLRMLVKLVLILAHVFQLCRVRVLRLVSK